MLGVQRRVIAAGAVTIAVVFGTAGQASADIDLSINIDGILRGEPGQVIQVASSDVPAEFVGQRCDLAGRTWNQTSIHPDTDLLIVNGDQTLILQDVEDEGNVEHSGGTFETVSDSIEVFVRLGPDGISSGGFTVTLDCAPVPPTTEAPTTTVPDPEGPEVTEPAVETTTTQMAETTTTEPMATTTTIPDPTGPTTEPTLPVTGTSSLPLALGGVTLLALGVLARNHAVAVRKLDL